MSLLLLVGVVNSSLQEEVVVVPVLRQTAFRLAFVKI